MFKVHDLHLIAQGRGELLDFDVERAVIIRERSSGGGEVIQRKGRERLPALRSASGAGRVNGQSVGA
jgi:hypothetical protein